MTNACLREPAFSSQQAIASCWSDELYSSVHGLLGPGNALIVCQHVDKARLTRCARKSDITFEHVPTGLCSSLSSLREMLGPALTPRSDDRSASSARESAHRFIARLTPERLPPLATVDSRTLSSGSSTISAGSRLRIPDMRSMRSSVAFTPISSAGCTTAVR
jgi:hypothetical protein